MEEGPQENILSLSLDRAAAQVARESGSEPTRSGSAESGVTIGGSRNFGSYECFCCGNAGVRLDDSSGWTNEKHNLYLDYLEASFVEQLYRSICLRSLRTQLPENSSDSRDQFVVLRHGCPQKISFGKRQTFLDREIDSHLARNPLEHALTMSEKTYCGGSATVESVIGAQEINQVHGATFSFGSVSNTEKSFEYCTGYGDLVPSIAEAWGQNFVDEDEEYEDCGPREKKLKTSNEAGASSNNQVELLGKLHRQGTSQGTCNFSERDKEELLSENPERFTCEGADLHHFLRGS